MPTNNNIRNHKFDRNFLKTDINSSVPDHGDLYIPDDMLERFNRRDGNNSLLKPVFINKRMVLMGPMGAGKSSLFNRITGSTAAVSDQLETCTTKISTANALGPAKELVVCDTPGTAASDRNGMTVDQAMQLRKALVTGIVSQIVIVIAATNNHRGQALSDQLFPLDKVMDCSTFRQDTDGTDVVMKDKRSPHRTRPFVVVTHRDRIDSDARGRTREKIEKLRNDFPWIGPVAFIDQDVSLSWLYNTIVAFSGYEGANLTNHSIPLVEMFSNFKISFPPIKDAWTEIIENAKVELGHGIMCVQHRLKDVDKVKIKEGRNVCGHHVDKVAPTLDCIMRFIDDIYEKTAYDALASCYETSLDDMWLDDNEDLLNEKFNTLNVIRKELAGTLVPARRKILAMFPRTGESAVYKRCTNPNCGAVYMKPTGCNYLGQCGLLAGVARDKDHNGDMNLAIQYNYEWNGSVESSLTLQEGRKRSYFENLVLGIRRKVRDVAQFLPINHSNEYLDTFNIDALTAEEVEQLIKADKKYGCGKTLKWDSMIPLSPEELVESGLVPDASAVAYEVVADISSMKIQTFLVEKCGETFERYVDNFVKNGLETMKDVMEFVDEMTPEALLEEIGITNRLHRHVIERTLRLYKS